MRCVVLFAKAPIPGNVKTRLSPPLSPDDAALLQEAFLVDTFSNLERIKKADLFLACHPGVGSRFFRDMGERFDVSLLDQGSGNLGERMRRIFIFLKSKGYGEIIIIGSDSPTLPPEMIEEGFGRLKGCNLAIGPSLDGGYYLLGISGDVPEIFEGVNWGSETVYEETVARAKADKVEFAVLPYWYDVDTIKELRFLAIHLAALPQSSYARTRAVIEELNI